MKWKWLSQKREWKRDFSLTFIGKGEGKLFPFFPRNMRTIGMERDKLKLKL